MVGRVPNRRDAYEDNSHRRVFGARVADLRREHGLTQEQLAERTDIHRSYLAAVETGVRNPTLDVVVRIARGLDVPLARLFE